MADSDVEIIDAPTPQRGAPNEAIATRKIKRAKTEHNNDQVMTDAGTSGSEYQLTEEGISQEDTPAEKPVFSQRQIPLDEETSLSREASSQDDFSEEEDEETFKEKQRLLLIEIKDKIQFHVVTNDGKKRSTVLLTGAKNLFQACLPAMPKDYVALEVYDRQHCTMVLIRCDNLEVLGGICFRNFEARGFTEVVFCGVSGRLQKTGYGALMMAHLKDYLRLSSPVMHLLTFADNSAVQFFKKQGFSKDVTLHPSLWKGVIKDYYDVTLMHCAMLPRISYVHEKAMLQKQRENIEANIRAFNATQRANEVVHAPPAAWANGVIIPIDPNSIPAIAATKWSPEMDTLSREAKGGRMFNDMQKFLNAFVDHKSAWPFKEPVDAELAPGYYDIIEHPMDTSTVREKLEKGEYEWPVDMIKDLDLMLDNCQKYNGKYTPYYKCSVTMRRFLRKLTAGMPEWKIEFS